MQPFLLIIESHPAMRQALRLWLSALFPQCRVLTARTGASGLRTACTGDPCIVVIDVRLSCRNSLDTVRRIKVRNPDADIVVFTLCDAEAYRTAAIRAGACGYVLKSQADQELLPLLKRLVEKQELRRKGGVAVHHVVTTKSRQTRKAQ